MPRVSMNPPSSFAYRLGRWYSKRKLGKVIDPLTAMAHQPRGLLAYSLLEFQLTRCKAMNAKLKHLALMASSIKIGCVWCIDFGDWEAPLLGLSGEQIRAVREWRESTVFTELERFVLEYAEAMTDTPPTVSDELAARLVAELGEPAFVELTTMVAVENLRSRLNSALGLSSQGFTDGCALPSVHDHRRL